MFVLFQVIVHLQNYQFVFLSSPTTFLDELFRISLYQKKKKSLKIEPTEVQWLLEWVQAERGLVSLMLLLADLNSVRCLGMTVVQVRD